MFTASGGYGCMAYLSQGKTVQLRDNTNLLAQEESRA